MILLGLAAALAVSLADGSAPVDGAKADLEWLRGRTLVARASTEVRGGALLLPPPPPGSDGFRIAGPDYLSRPSPIGGRALPLVLVRAARLLVRTHGRGGTLYLLAEDPREEALVREIDRAAEEERILVWPQTYGVAFDPGPGGAVQTRRLECVPSGEYSIAGTEHADSEHARPVRLRVVDPSGHPIGGAGVQVPAKAALEDRAGALALRHRAGMTGADGLLYLGLLSRRPEELRVEKPGLRNGVVAQKVLGEASGEPWPVTMKPYADISILWRGISRRDQPTEVVVERCRAGGTDSPCITWESVGSTTLDDAGRGRARGLRPGSYRLILKPPSPSFAMEERELPWDSTEPDPDEVVFTPEEWRLGGMVEDSQGRPVAGATVAATPIATAGFAPAFAAECPTAPDGTFTLRFLTSSREVGVTARAAEPPAAARMQRVGSADRWKADLMIRMVRGAVDVEVRGREDDAPLEGCRVTLRAQNVERGEVRTARTDSSGRAQFVGLGRVAAVVEARCDGRVPSSGTAVETSEESSRVTIRLERSAALSVRVSDVGGRAVSGASVFVPETGRLVGPFEVPIIPIGRTGPDGRLEIAGDQHGASPVFVVAEGRALGVARLADARCSGAECETDVVLRHPMSFPGAIVTSAAGQVLPPNGLVFSYAGIPLPFDLVPHVASANGFPASGFFVATGDVSMSVLPGYLPPGDYEVGYLVGSKQTRQLRAVPAGYLRLPTSSLVELRVHAIP